MNKRGLLIVISGFSGAGKGTIVKELVRAYHYRLSISATTRAPRIGEVHGSEYFFLTREEFESMIVKNELLEYAQYVGNYYGTPKEFVNQELESGKDVILEIEIQGALKVKQAFPEALMIFITPPTAKELKERLTKRATEEEAVVLKRMARSYEEVVFMEQYDYIVVNDLLSECVEQIHSIVANEKCRTKRELDFMEEMKQELIGYSKGEI